MTVPQVPPPPTPGRAPIGRIVLIVLGAALVLVGLVLGAIGTALVLVQATQRDADGFFTSDTARLETVSYAITSEEIDLGTQRGQRDRRFDLGDLATVRISVDSEAERAVFVGIAPEADVSAYLDGVGRAEIVDLQFDPFRVGYDYSEGGAPAAPPGDEDFWAASAEGVGRQSVEWELESGNWSVVVMNADASAGVSVDTAVGVQADWILPAGIVLLVISVVLLVGGTISLVAGAHGLGAIAHGQPVTGPSPVRLEGRLDLPLSRGLWIVKVLLLIPHFVALFVLWVAFVVVTAVAGVAILFTGRYPRSLFDFNAGVLRWSWRVSFYSFGGFATDRYPPFSLGPVPDYPASLDIAYPEQLSRGLVLVKWWLLAIPHYIVVTILAGGGFGNEPGQSAPGLIPVIVFFAAISLLFTARYPKGIFDLAMGGQRWVFRTIAYAALMTDEYPPFRLDQGPAEPDEPRRPTPGPESS